MIINCEKAIVLKQWIYFKEKNLELNFWFFPHWELLHKNNSKAYNIFQKLDKNPLQYILHVWPL